MSYISSLDEPAALTNVVVNQSIDEYDATSQDIEAKIDAAAAHSMTNNQPINQSADQPHDHPGADVSVSTDRLINATNQPILVKLSRDVLIIERINQSTNQSKKQSKSNRPSINQYNVHDLIGCSIDGLKLTLHLYPRKSSKHARTYQSINLRTTDQSVVDLWHLYFTRAARSLPLINQPLPNRSIKIIVNPSSGTGNAESKANLITPMINQSGIPYTVESTNRSGHAYDIANQLPIDQSTTQSIVCVSGDGLLYEIINGLMHRPDWLTAINQSTIGVIAGGGGNGFARSMCHVSDETFDVVSQAFIIIKGYTRKLDLASITRSSNQSTSTPEPPIFSMLSLAWSMVSDIDLRSDAYRWMGGARFTAAALSVILGNKPHNAEVEYLPANTSTINRPLKRSQAIMSLPDSKPCTNQSTCAHCWKTSKDSETESLKDFLQSHQSTNPSPKSDPSIDQWKSIPSSPYRVLWGMNVPWAASDLLPAPRAHFSDGTLDLLLVRKCGRLSLIDVMTGIEDGSHLKNEDVDYFKIRGLRVKPETGDVCPYSVDGEGVPSAQIELRMWRAVLNVHSK